MHFITESQIDSASLHLLGGKGAQLWQLTLLGLPVPHWGVLPFHISLDDHAESVLEELVEYFGPSARLAIRSSATDEDGSQLSFAGMYTTLLHVPIHQAISAIQEVRESVFAAEAHAYRQANETHTPAKMSVIIQEMVAADVSGVAFGLDPVSGNRQGRVINAVFGLGEGLVSGKLPADTFRWEQGSWHAQVVDKSVMVQPEDSDQLGVRLGKVPADLRRLPTLSSAKLTELRQLLDLLEKEWGRPQDVEFAYQGDRLQVLQARPVTGLDQLPDRTAKPRVWDNSNIVESYPGQTLPLTFSFILRMYEGVYRQLSLLFGISQKVLDQHAGIYRNMLGLMKGRVYYNLRSWYEALALLPGYSLNARYMETMMGVQERFDVDKRQGGKWYGWLGIGRMVARMVFAWRRLPKETRKFQQHLAAVLEEYKTVDWNRKSIEEILAGIVAFEGKLLTKWKPPMVNDFFAMIFFGLLKKSVEGVGPEIPVNLHNDLLCGASDIVSTEPIDRMLALSEMIQQDPHWHESFQNLSPEILWSSLKLQDSSPLMVAIQAYLDKFGDRCIGELKLESIPYQDHPEAMISMLQSFVRQGLKPTTAAEGKGKVIRSKAEKILNERTRSRPFKRWMIGGLLRNTRRLVSNRENLRFARTLAFGTVRMLYRELGRKLWVENLLNDREDIFYLTQQEITGFVEGTAIDVDLKGLVEFRKRQYAIWSDQQPDPRFRTYGPVHTQRVFKGEMSPSDAPAELTGIGCCPGVVRARVRMVHHPKDLKDLAGDILVCISTDPGWVPLFPTAAGLLVARGSLLSHAAIVAREMGKPCIVGIDGLMQGIQTGDWVEMDGATGQIRRIDPPTETEPIDSTPSTSYHHVETH
ncbi:PEP/pyruvate-binding domain-containing protein [Pontibacter sp. G13]|uniref:PEP/pyruvate-binding domain-containing protein n=1 Tax=Pontibacter sp. G13 TaxID=3074898 RepID=UPI00288A3F51|nr:PEP/pyruvate-binding domain-containing protein [Pontibacter sp. G13]WNJ17832.1 PEP/pyruvate-binding domain-containing protein [Pontibacter sp. G13]